MHFGKYMPEVFFFSSPSQNYYCLTALHKTCQGFFSFFFFFFLIGRDKESKDVGEKEAFWHWVFRAFFPPILPRKNSCGNPYNMLSISGPFRWWNCAENVSAATSFSPLCAGPIREHLVHPESAFLLSNWLSVCSLLGLPQCFSPQSFLTTWK